MASDEEDRDGDALAAYVQTLFPMQQQAIATAQLAGCRFEARRYERFVGSPIRENGRRDWSRASRWITTTGYEIFLPDGTSAGTGEDIYECALIALRILDTPTPAEKPDMGLFKLNPENEPQ